MKKIIRQQGFSMIEVLVTLVIIATALLGTAGLQAHALKTSKGSEFRNQAIFLSGDIVERMEANKAEAVLGAYVVAANLAGATNPASTACDTGSCTGAALAAYDLANWQAAVAALPTGSGSITLDTAGNPATYTIQVSWVDRATSQNSAGAAAVSGGKGELFSVTTSKMIRTD
jgi:type IV pilus assembly protein PilV